MISSIMPRDGIYRVQIASVHSMPVSSETSNISRACCVFAPNAFSTSTPLPACMHKIACSAWKLCGVAIYTRFTFGSATSSSYDPYDTGKPYFAANAAARSPSRAATAYGATRSRYRSSAAIFTNVSAMLCAIRPAPRIATLICAMKSPCFELPVCYVAMTSVRHMRRRHALCEND